MSQIELAIKYTEEIMNTFDDEGHQIGHIYNVLHHLNNALKYNTFDLSKKDVLNLKLATILHDVDDHKFTKNTNYENANNILDKIGVEDKKEIIEMITWVSCSENRNDNSMTKDYWKLWVRVVDRLEAIGSIGIYRAYVYTILKKRPMYSETCLIFKTKEELNKYLWTDGKKRFNNYSGGSNSFLDHFLDKVLHIANCDAPEVKCNKYLLKIAKERHQYLLEFYVQCCNNLENIHNIIDKFID